MSPAPIIRPATLADVPAIRSILAAHGNDGPITGVDIVGPYVRHLVTNARALVTADGDEVVAYGAAIDVGIAVHLADLFVRPDRLGRGIGRPLLTAVYSDAERRTTFASNDPRALPLYVRAGMAPLWPSLYVEGDGDSIPPSPGSLTLKSADAARLASLELAWTGVDRSIDHAFWASLADADSFVALDSGEPVAIAHARARQGAPARVIDRLLVRPGADATPIILAAIRRAGRGGAVVACIPGPSPVLPALLARRFRITERDQFMASEPDLVDPLRLIPDPGML